MKNIKPYLYLDGICRDAMNSFKTCSNAEVIERRFSKFLTLTDAKEPKRLSELLSEYGIFVLPPEEDMSVC